MTPYLLILHSMRHLGACLRLDDTVLSTPTSAQGTEESSVIAPRRK